MIFRGLALLLLSAIVYLLARLVNVSTLGTTDEILTLIVIGSLVGAIIGALYVVSGITGSEATPASFQRPLDPRPDQQGRANDDRHAQPGLEQRR
jgi:uncharacterized membrane protein required for colicin V production